MPPKEIFEITSQHSYLVSGQIPALLLFPVCQETTVEKGYQIYVVVRKHSHDDGESRYLVAQGILWKGYMELLYGGVRYILIRQIDYPYFYTF